MLGLSFLLLFFDLSSAFSEESGVVTVADDRRRALPTDHSVDAHKRGRSEVGIIGSVRATDDVEGVRVFERAMAQVADLKRHGLAVAI